MANVTDWKEGLREEAIEDEPTSLGEVLGDDETTSDETWSWEKAVEEIKRRFSEGDPDDVAYVEQETASLGNAVARLKEIAERRDQSMTEFQKDELEDAVANMQSDVLELLDFEIDDAGRKGDLFYTAIGLIQAAYTIGRNAKGTVEAAARDVSGAGKNEVAKPPQGQGTASEDILAIADENAVAAFVEEHDPIRLKIRRARRLGIQAPMREALRHLYGEDPVLKGTSRNTVRNAAANRLNLPIGAISLATLDRARVVAWPIKEEVDETDDT